MNYVSQIGSGSWRTLQGTRVQPCLAPQHASVATRICELGLGGRGAGNTASRGVRRDIVEQMDAKGQSA